MRCSSLPQAEQCPLLSESFLQPGHQAPRFLQETAVKKASLPEQSRLYPGSDDACSIKLHLCSIMQCVPRQRVAVPRCCGQVQEMYYPMGRHSRQSCCRDLTALWLKARKEKSGEERPYYEAILHCSLDAICRDKVHGREYCHKHGRAHRCAMQRSTTSVKVIKCTPAAYCPSFHTRGML